MAAELKNYSLFSDANLVSYYRMEGDSTDEKGVNSGTDTSMAYSTASGMFGQGGTFDGANSKIATALSLMNVDKTVFAWIKTSATSYQQIANQWSNPCWLLGVNTSGKLEYISNDAGGSTVTTGLTTINTGAWFFVAATYLASTNQTILYVNGASDKDATGRDERTTPTTGMAIGRENQAASFSPFNGSIDDVAIFSRVLTGTEILNYYNFVLTSGRSYMTTNTSFWGG